MGGRGGVVAFVYFPFPPRTRALTRTAAVTVVLRAGGSMSGRGGNWKEQTAVPGTGLVCVRSFARASWGLRVASVNLTASLLVLQALAGSLGPVQGSLALLWPPV